MYRKREWAGDCLEPLGLSVTQAAKTLNVSRKQLRPCEPPCRNFPGMAIRLDKAFGGVAETWHRIQASHDMAQTLKCVPPLEALDRCRRRGQRLDRPLQGGVVCHSLMSTK